MRRDLLYPHGEPGTPKVQSPPQQGEVKIDSRGAASIPAAAIAEAKSVRFSVSLFLLIALAGGSYYVGRLAGIDNGRASKTKDLACQDQEKLIRETNERYQRILELRGLDAGHLSVIESGVGKANTRLEVIESHVKK